MRYREILGHLGFEVGIEMGETVSVVASPILSLSPHVLYTNVVEPILRWTFVKEKATHWCTSDYCIRRFSLYDHGPH